MVDKTHKLVQSYLLNRFFISTAYRRCSAITVPSIWYYETIVWVWESETRECGRMIEQQDSGTSRLEALNNHFLICEKYLTQ